MTLIHYDRQPFILDRDVDYHQDPVLQRNDKPRGLWISDTADETNWASWCLQEDYDIEGLATPHEVTLADTAKILTLTSAQALHDFTAEYQSTDDDISQVLNRGRSVWAIDWPRIYDQYDGILITPYQWTCRTNMNTAWYWGWDCASGCIWDLHAINSFTPITVPTTI